MSSNSSSFRFEFMVLTSERIKKWKRILSLKFAPAVFTKQLEGVQFNHAYRNVVVCAAKGPRPRYPRVWKTRKRVGTISKSIKLAQCINGMSNVKEEVCGALDSFIAWELELPLITVKKALKTLENEKEWKRIIQVTKWMLSKGQGRTMGSYYMLINALAEDGRLDEAEELWANLFSENLERIPRIFFDKMLSIYYHREMHDKMFETFADMEELGIRPTMSIVRIMGDVFQKLGMMDKYTKLNQKYPPPKWIYRFVKGKRIKVKATDFYTVNRKPADESNEEDANNTSIGEAESSEFDMNEQNASVDHYQNQSIDTADSVGTMEASVS